MARLLFLAFDAAGQMHVVKAVRNAGHKVAQCEPRAADAHTLVRQQGQPMDVIVCDGSQRAGQARETLAFLRGVAATKATPILVFNVKKEETDAWTARVPGITCRRDDDVVKALADLGFVPG